MPRISFIQTNFTAGELSPRLTGRTDLERYFNGMELLENLIVFPHGGCTRRGGTQFIAEVKDSSKKTRLIPFEFSTVQAYILELGDLYIRVYKELGRIEVAGVPVEIVTPYTETELSDIQFIQSADTLYLVHPNHPPAKLTRSSHTAWTYSVLSFTAPPAVWGVGNYPGVVAFFEQRFILAATPNEPQTVWGSRSNDFLDLTLGTGADDAWEYTIASGQVNKIQWASSGQVLELGTAGGIFIASASTLEEAITPTNIRITQQATSGSANISPVRVGPLSLFIQRAKRKILEFVYQFETNSYTTNDITLLSEHITESGLLNLVYQQEPDSILWATRTDGRLLSCTYQRDQQVVSWQSHVFGGQSDVGGTDPVVESLAVIPQQDETRDELWCEVYRWINGGIKRYIEVVSSGYSREVSVEQAFFTDSTLTYDGPPVTSFSGLDHLEGETVSIVADGAVRPSQKVVLGVVTLSSSASIVHMGLHKKARGKTLRIDAGSVSGSAQGKRKRVHETIFRLYKTVGLQFGPNETSVDLVPFRSSLMAMDSAVDLFTGDKVIPMPSTWGREGQVYFEQVLPLPFTLLAIIQNLQTNG